MNRKVFVLGYPGPIGGACTELWHTVKTWRANGVDVVLCPTWGNTPQPYKRQCDDIGCTTEYYANVADFVRQRATSLRGCNVLGMCNDAFLKVAGILRDAGARLLWANCMTFAFQAELDFLRTGKGFDVVVFQSQHQSTLLQKRFADEEIPFDVSTSALIRGAFDPSEFPYAPRPHAYGEAFYIGRHARPDADKWSSNTWNIYTRIAYEGRRALMLGVADNTLERLGRTPEYASTLRPDAIPAQAFLSLLHCLLPINGGAGENWPRAGLEAMSAGVPVVAQNSWGWQEMITHGETGFLGNNDAELSHYAATLAYDNSLRLRMACNARDKIESEFGNHETNWRAWDAVL
jgi:hypothetical protein